MYEFILVIIFQFTKYLSENLRIIIKENKERLLLFCYITKSLIDNQLTVKFFAKFGHVIRLIHGHN